MLRVVIDTNVWVSGIIWSGKPYRCLLLGLEGSVQVFHCSEMLVEIEEKLTNKFGYPKTAVSNIMDEYKKSSQEVIVGGDLRVVQQDPKDDMFIECAGVANADFLVTGDKHLLSIRKYEGTSIVSPAEFLEIVLNAE